MAGATTVNVTDRLTVVPRLSFACAVKLNVPIWCGTPTSSPELCTAMPTAGSPRISRRRTEASPRSP